MVIPVCEVKKNGVVWIRMFVCIAAPGIWRQFFDLSTCQMLTVSAVRVHVAVTQ